MIKKQSKTKLKETTTNTKEIKLTIPKTVNLSSKFDVNIFDKKNKVVGIIKLNKKIWGVETSPELISFVVTAEQAAQRQGTKKIKERGEVSGGGRKPWKQKGTGRARAGSIRSPIWRGGGITFGPTGNENYVKKVNKKVYKKVILGCLNQILFNDRLIVLKEFEMKKPSTKEIKNFLNNFKILGQKILFILNLEDENIILSLRNMNNCKIVSFDNLTIFDLLNSKKVIIFEKLFSKLEEKLIK